MFAMKYINKEACLKQRAVENIVAEVDLLRSIDHPFIVRLWFTFQVSSHPLVQFRFGFFRELA